MCWVRSDQTQSQRMTSPKVCKASGNVIVVIAVVVINIVVVVVVVAVV